MNKAIEFFKNMQSTIYQQNVEMGWHDKPRSLAQFICLFHSEVSEGTEGLRKNLLDSHLPKWPMVAVELADTIIRILDYLGYLDNICHDDVSWDYKIVGIEPKEEMVYNLANIHMLISEAWLQRGSLNNSEHQLKRAALTCYNVAEFNGWDIENIIKIKLNYNKTRVDHQPSNRKKKGGAQW